MCGEQFSDWIRPVPETGSSPRVRGTGCRRRPFQHPKRFIPACAGNRLSRTTRGPALPVHPRVCGEQRANSLTNTCSGGSSPRVRGTGLGALGKTGAVRFIPACAGNRISAISSAVSAAVHPRVCGEQVTCPARSTRQRGSSPRVRGTEWLRSGLQIHERFIPACAGNRLLAACRMRLATVHPRVCGEQPLPPCARRLGIGSSPRVRGTGIRSRQRGRSRRFIPACAGNS